MTISNPQMKVNFHVPELRGNQIPLLELQLSRTTMRTTNYDFLKQIECTLPCRGSKFLSSSGVFPTLPWHGSVPKGGSAYSHSHISIRILPRRCGCTGSRDCLWTTLSNFLLATLNTFVKILLEIFIHKGILPWNKNFTYSILNLFQLIFKIKTCRTLLVNTV